MLYDILPEGVANTSGVHVSAKSRRHIEFSPRMDGDLGRVRACLEKQDGNPPSVTACVERATIAFARFFGTLGTYTGELPLTKKGQPSIYTVSERLDRAWLKAQMEVYAGDTYTERLAMRDMRLSDEWIRAVQLIIGGVRTLGYGARSRSGVNARMAVALALAWAAVCPQDLT